MASWVDQYRQKVVSAEEAVKVIQSGTRVYVGAGCAVPHTLLDAMVKRAPELRDVEVTHILSVGEAPYIKPEMEGHFRGHALFTGANIRQAVNEGRADFMPVHLSEIPQLFLEGHLPLDVAMVNVSPPDEHGFCSFGIEVGCTKPAAHSARCVLAEVNERMPRTLGDSFIHVSKLAACVETSVPLDELPQGAERTDVENRIGRLVADLIEDGSTLQLGIGAIPDAVLHYLRDKKDLGVHSEMFSDGLMELVEEGIVNNEKKTLHPGKVIVGFVLGTNRLFDFVDDNALIEFHPTDYVNDPFRIAQNDKMVSINSALQVDLTGQVCADSIGHYIYSGVGGQVDFVRGAARSRGGKAVIALRSTAKGGEISRIVPHLGEGAGVVTTRASVRYVATEYGVADLFGKSIRQRARALIEIAHPDFRVDLWEAARKTKLIR